MRRPRIDHGSSPGRGKLKPAIPGVPLAERRITDAAPSAKLGHFRPLDRFSRSGLLLQHADDLLFAEPAAPHIRLLQIGDRLCTRMTEIQGAGQSISANFTFHNWVEAFAFVRNCFSVRAMKSMIYSTGCHSVYHHRYHMVWSTKYRYAVLRGELRLRIRKIIRQICQELNVEIIKGVLSTDHEHMFIAVPPKYAISHVIQRMKGRSSYRIQREFPAIKKRYWGRHFWAKSYFSTTSSNIADDVILLYLENHVGDPTDASRVSFSCHF